MWGLFRTKPNEIPSIPAKLLKFLNMADELYTSAYKTRSITPMKGFLTRDLCCKVANIVAREGSQRYLSNPSFRKTVWTLRDGDIEKDEKIRVQKEVTYDTIKVTPSRKMKVAQDYIELWDVDKEQPIVLDIIQVDEEE